MESESPSRTISELTKDYAESADDYGRFLNDNSRYRGAFQFQNDPVQFVQAIAAAGYATDPHHAEMLTRIIRSFHLEDYDK
jgi:flagellum-specific peptidoglycan hydrolase FlgJ